MELMTIRHGKNDFIKKVFNLESIKFQVLVVFHGDSTLSYNDRRNCRDSFYSHSSLMYGR
jgi:hypothetical protein